MPTIRTGAAAGALVLAAGLGIPAATAQATPRPRPVATSAFTTVHTTTFTAQAVGSPAAGEVVVAGVQAAAGTEGPIMVDLAKKNHWRTLTLSARASRVKIATAGGTTWILGMGATPTLWRSHGNHVVQVAMPTLPAGMTAYHPTAIAAEGRSVALWGLGDYTNRPRMGAIARLDNGRWTVKDNLHPGSLYGPTPALYPSESVMALIQGHVLADTTFGGGGIGLWLHLFDYAVTPAEKLGTMLLSSPYGDMVTVADMLARTPSDVTLWGGQRAFISPQGQTLRDSGVCMRMKDGESNRCPAPDWKVTAATRLVDGRTVLGGQDSFGLVDRKTGTATNPIPAGYALIAKDGATPNPLPGDPGDAVVDLAAEPTGTTVWSVVRTGTGTAVQRGTVAGTFTVRQGRR